MDFDEFSRFAHRLASAAAARTLPLFRAALHVEDKGLAEARTAGTGPEGAGAPAFDPVTEADRGAEQAIRALIEQTYPDHGILGEEFEETPGDGWRWVLDPVDGTRSFISGIPLWTTIIGLEKDGVPVFGMVDQPYIGDRFWGHAGGSMWRNRFEEAAPLRVRPCPGLDEATLMTTSPTLMPDEDALRRYAAVERRVRLARYGADGYAYVAMAGGGIDLVVESGLKPYDIVGIIPIIAGAGGIVTDWSGATAAKGGSIVAAGDRAVHEQALSILRP